MYRSTDMLAVGRIDTTFAFVLVLCSMLVVGIEVCADEVPVEIGLIANGSFEKVIPGMRPPLPSRWLAERWSHRDTIALVCDAAEAHRGRRFVRIHAPDIHGLRIHSTAGIRIKSSTTYVIRLWARRVGSFPAELSVEPGGGTFELTDDWKQYTIRYTHLANGKTAMGMFVAIQGGPADLDDVSMVEQGSPEPISPELRRSWRKLEEAPADKTWTERRFEERIPVVVCEVVGDRASNYAVTLELGALFRSYRFDFVLPEKIKVVDSSLAGGREVPWSIINADENPNLSGHDRLIFLADCPPRTRKLYYVYLQDRQIAQDTFRPIDQLSVNVDVVCDYAYQLDVDVGDSEARLSAIAHVADGRLEVDMRGWTACSAAAQVISLDGHKHIPLGLKMLEPGHWKASLALGLSPVLCEGIWRLQAEFVKESGITATRTADFVLGHAMWSGSNAQRIYPDDPPRYGRSMARVAAAAGEWESFQVAIGSEKGLEQVNLEVTDLHQEGHLARIDADQITIESVEQTYTLYGFRSGFVPDPLLPWRKRDIEAGTHHVAYVTIRVPQGALAGIYTAELVARSTTGVAARMPIELEVFGFALPQRRSFTPVLRADIKWLDEDAPHKPVKQKGRFRYATAFPMPHRRTRIDSARFFGQRHMTPFYYNHANGPYPVPWSWDAQSKTVKADFAQMNEALELFDELDIKYLFIASKYRVTLNRGGGGIYYYQPDVKQYVYGRRDTKLGEQMMRAYLKAMVTNLRQKQWADRTIIYINDESWNKRTNDGKDTNALISDYGRLIHDVAPEFATFVADDADSDNILGPFAETDHLTGPINEANLDRLRKRGGHWWGLYNRNPAISLPLGVARIIGMDCYFRGWAHYFHVDVTRWSSNPWVNPRRYMRAGGKRNFFVAGSSTDGFDMCVYPWPSYGFTRWQPDLPTLCSSLRLEALRESVDDYEYLKMLVDAAERLPADSPVRKECAQLITKARDFVARCNTGSDWRYDGSRSVFVVDGDELESLRRQIGRVLAHIRVGEGHAAGSIRS